MKYKVGDIVQFEKDCVLPAGGSIAAGSRWRVKEVEENYYELWYRDEHLPDWLEMTKEGRIINPSEDRVPDSYRFKVV